MNYPKSLSRSKIHLVDGVGFLSSGGNIEVCWKHDRLYVVVSTIKGEHVRSLLRTEPHIFRAGSEVSRWYASGSAIPCSILIRTMIEVFFFFFQRESLDPVITLHSTPLLSSITCKSCLIFPFSFFFQSFPITKRYYGCGADRRHSSGFYYIILIHKAVCYVERREVKYKFCFVRLLQLPSENKTQQCLFSPSLLSATSRENSPPFVTRIAWAHHPTIHQMSIFLNPEIQCLAAQKKSTWAITPKNSNGNGFTWYGTEPMSAAKTVQKLRLDTLETPARVCHQIMSPKN